MKTKELDKNDKPADPLSLQTLIGVTERKLFGFKCTVRDGTLAEREAERRVHTFFAVLFDSRIVLFDTHANVERTTDELLPGILDYISPIYRTAEKELSTGNILSDVVEYLKNAHIELRFASSLPKN